MQRDFFERFFGVGRFSLEKIAHRGESFGVGILKTVDRLFFIADDKQSAVVVARRAPEKNSSAKRRDDIPLRAAGILRFIDQQMIKPVIEFMQNPGRDAGTLQQVQRFVHKIIVIKRAL